MNKQMLVFFMLCTSIYFAKAQTINWLSQHPVASGDDYYKAMTYDDAGYAYSTGNEDVKVNFSNCSGKIIVSCFKPSGAIHYSTPYQPSSNNNICDDGGNAILHHANSGKLIIGGKENFKAFLGYFDASTGAFINKANITTTGAQSEVKGLHLSGNHIFAVGYFKNSISFGGSSTITLTGSAQDNIFIAKFDLSGNVLQAIKATGIGTASAIGFDIVEDPNGNIYISASANNDVVFNGTTTYNISGSGHKLIVFKLNSLFNFSSGTVVGTAATGILADVEIPLQLDWSGFKLVVGGVHQNQQKSFLTKLDISSSTPSILYTHNLNRVIRDIAIDCNHIYLTGTKGWGANFNRQRRAGPCSNTYFLFLDKHDLSTGAQLSTKQASGCTFGEAIVVDDKDRVWLNGTFGDPNSVSFESLSQNFSYNGKNGLISKLTADQTCIPKPYSCCPGNNVVVNGNFESGNSGFTNNYTYQAAVAAGSIAPGQYGIVNGGQAATINSSWNAIQDPSSCSNSWGNFLLVNGQTGTTSKVIWEQTMPVQDWNGYKFCFKAKNLNQGASTVQAKLEVQFSMPFGNIIETISAPLAACDWQEISRNVDLWGFGNSLNIKIILDQTASGTGNDVAIDNIALLKLNRCPAATANFDIQTSSNLTNFSVTATADIIAPCNSVWWEVCKYDVSSGDCISTTKLNGVWWNTVTNFPGYNGSTTQSGSAPGIFEYGYFYRITRGTWGDCNSWISSSKYIGAPSARNRLKTYTEKQFKSNEKRIARKFKAEKERVSLRQRR